MRKNSTLPSLKGSLEIVTDKSKESYKKLQSKLNSHDAEIVRNQKIIVTLTSEFKVLKDQLLFQQDYSEQAKLQVIKLENDNIKIQKQFKELKVQMQKAQKEKNQRESQITLLKEQLQKINLANDNTHNFIKNIEQLEKINRKKDKTIKDLENELQKLGKDKIVQQNQHKTDLIHLKASKNQNQADSVLKIQKIEKQLQLVNVYLANCKETIMIKQNLINQIHSQNQIIKNQLLEKSSTEVKLQKLHADLKFLDDENLTLKKKNKSLEDAAIKQAQIQNSLISQRNKGSNQEIKQKSEKIERLSKEIDQLKRNLKSQEKQKGLIEEKFKNQLKMLEERLLKLKKYGDELHQLENSLKKSIICDLCEKIFKNPVTNIPCGHSYCQECKKGYEKECKKCPGLKREAVYRNQLMDDIVNAYSCLTKVSKLIQERQ